MKRSVLPVALAFVLTACGGGAGGGGGTSITPGGSGGSGGGGVGSTPTPPPGGTAITLTVTGGASPSVAAVQSGTGTWTKIAMTGSTATFTVPAGTARYGVAIVCGKSELIEMLTVTDSLNPSITCGGAGGTSQSLGFDASGINNATNADLYVGSAFQEETIPKGTGDVRSAPAGTQDVSLIAYDNNGDPLAVKIERGVNITGGPMPAIVDTNADLTGKATLTMSAPPSGFTATVNDWYQTAGGADLELQDQAAMTWFPTLAAADAQNGDVYHIEAFAASNGAIPNEVGVFSTFSKAANQTLTFPAPLSYGGPVPAQYPAFSVPEYGGFNITGNAAYEFAIFGSSSSIEIGASPQYLKINGDTLTVPDLSSLGGFISAPSSGNRETWILGERMTTTPLDGNYLGRQPPSSNSLLEYAQEAGEFTVP